MNNMILVQMINNVGEREHIGVRSLYLLIKCNRGKWTLPVKAEV